MSVIDPKQALARAEKVHINALCDEFERALKTGESPRLEDLLIRVVEVARPVALRELLKVEVELRRDLRENITVEEYLGRFPLYCDAVRDVFHQSDVRLATVDHHDAGLATSDYVTRAHCDSDTGSGRLEVRCPSCHAPTEVAVDTSLTDLTCSSCGSHFSLVDQSKATRMAPTLTKMGRFDLIERIGVGGFGSVWKARDKELDRTVAIKIPRASGMTPEEQEKFFREARAAAQLKHPNIVSVHEVGRNGDSVYIVSDFVRGVTLGDWLTGQQITGREAAELCAKIADALHHAHEQGVVHRDLKPANIMMDYDGQPHLMDFGLAHRETGEVTMTMDGQVLGTPAYMSPEQAQGEGHQADRRSDVYSLGVVLFQLLTGELPFRGNARMLIKQVITDEPPSPRKLNANIKKDLETITLKCLEKDSSKRYQSANELAVELRRFLNGEPIHARPISRSERTVRWMRRNKVVSALAGCVALALVCGTIVSSYFAIAARKQADIALAKEADALAAKQDADAARRNAEDRQKESERSREAERQAKESAQAREVETAAVLEFVENKILAANRPEGVDGGLGSNISLSQAIATALPFVEPAFAKQPLIEARLRNTLGMSFFYNGEPKLAVEQLEKAFELYSQQVGRGNRQTLLTMLNLANNYQWLGNPDKALKLREEALSLCHENLGSDDPATAKALWGLGKSYQGFDRHAEAVQTLEQALRIARAKFGPNDIYNTWMIGNELAREYSREGRTDEAIKLAQSDFDAVKEKLGQDHLMTLCFGLVLADLGGDSRKAIKAYEETLPRMKAKYGSDYPDALYFTSNLAGKYVEAGRHVEAIKLFEETLPLYRRKLGVHHPSSIDCTFRLADSYSDIGLREVAFTLCEEALSQKRTKPLDLDCIWLMDRIAGRYTDAGKYADAVKLHEEIFKYRREKLGPAHLDTLGSMSWLTLLLSTSPDEQVRDGQRAMELGSKLCELGKYNYRYHLQSFAAACAETGDFDSAVKWERKALDLFDAEVDSKTIVDSAQSMFADGRDRKERLDRIAHYKAKKPLRFNVGSSRLDKDQSHAAKLSDLALALASSADNSARSRDRALQVATRAAEMTDYKNPKILSTLAAAHAGAGDFESAVQWSEKALDLLGPSGNKDLHDELAAAVLAYKSKKPMLNP